MNCKTRDKVVLLNHGFLGSSTNFLINGPKESLGYLFSDACYDVWLMNARGNTYSLKHNTYTTDDEEYWKFSFDEMAEYDLPATIDHILEKTKQKSLYYVAHSQGATVGFEAFSENKTLAKKIRLFAALGPVGYAGYMTTSGTFYAEMTDETIYALLGHKSFLGGDWKREAFLKATCANPMTSNTCVKFGELLGGKVSSHFNKSRILVYYMHTPAGSSVQNLVHWTQMMRTKETHKHFYLDHLKNLAKYGSWTPPQIRFSRMDLPLVAFTGNHDTAADEKCELIKARGFMCEEHEVETKDGYILTLHRIPGWLRNDCQNDKVLLIHHSFLGSSADFLINSPKQSLGYLFADACFDVWLGNSRGNVYSMKHNIYTSDQKEFWQFSFDQMAEYDLPAMVDYILKKTSQKSLYYIGHSQGATIGLEAFSENRELAKKIRFFGALSPVAYVDGLTSSASTYAKMSEQTIHMMHGDKMFMGPDWKRETFIKTTCANSLLRSTCVSMGESLGGKFSSYLNKSRIAVYYMHTPAGGSVQNLIHWTQIMQSKEAKKFDYGNKMENLAKYGTVKPPKIDFKNATVPIGVFYGSNDIIADSKDVTHLLNELPNVVAKVHIQGYSHLDFLYATNAEETLLNPLLFMMKYY